MTSERTSEWVMCLVLGLKTFAVPEAQIPVDLARGRGLIEGIEVDPGDILIQQGATLLCGPMGTYSSYGFRVVSSTGDGALESRRQIGP